MSELEDNRDGKEKNDDLSFAKQPLGSQQNESKVLGLPWDKDMEIFNHKVPWDAQLSKQLVKRVESWEQSLPTA